MNPNTSDKSEVLGWGKVVRYNLSVIRKEKGKYVVRSQMSGRSFGTYKTLAEAKKRLRQIEMFKHLKRGK